MFQLPVNEVGFFADSFRHATRYGDLRDYVYCKEQTRELFSSFLNVPILKRCMLNRIMSYLKIVVISHLFIVLIQSILIMQKELLHLRKK